MRQGGGRTEMVAEGRIQDQGKGHSALGDPELSGRNGAKKPSHIQEQRDWGGGGHCGKHGLWAHANLSTGTCKPTCFQRPALQRND